MAALSRATLRGVTESAVVVTTKKGFDQHPGVSVAHFSLDNMFCTNSTSS